MVGEASLEAFKERILRLLGGPTPSLTRPDNAFPLPLLETPQASEAELRVETSFLYLWRIGCCSGDEHEQVSDFNLRLWLAVFLNPHPRDPRARPRLRRLPHEHRPRQGYLARQCANVP